jgi:hypothetical protein
MVRGGSSHPLRNADMSPCASERMVRAASLVLLLSASSIIPAPGQQYAVAGWLDTLSKTGLEDRGESNRVHFYAEVINARYKIRMARNAVAGDYYEYAVDDGTMRILHRVSGQTQPLSGAHTDKPGSARYPARVEERVIPPNDGTRAQFVWLTFASYPQLSRAPKQALLPIWSPEDPNTRRQPFLMETLVTLLPEPPGLPAQLVYLNDGVYRSYNPVTKKFDREPLPAPFDRGYTNAVYDVLATTNIAKWVLPSDFVFTVYCSPLGGRLYERLTVHGHVTSATADTPEHACLAPFDGVASVVDCRITGALASAGQAFRYDYASYAVTNNSWPTLTQLTPLRRGLETRIRVQASQALPVRRRARLVWGAVAAITAIFVGALIWRTRRQSS